MDSIDVVVDTNVFIKAIFHRDEFCKALFKLKSENKVKFVMNKETQNELLVTFFKLLQSILSKKEMLNIFPLASLLSQVLWQVKEIDHKTYTDYSTDIDDNKFVDCAIDGNVKYLITYDEHLNSISELLKEKHNIEVLSAYQFYTKFRLKKL